MDQEDCEAEEDDEADGFGNLIYVKCYNRQKRACYEGTYGCEDYGSVCPKTSSTSYYPNSYKVSYSSYKPSYNSYKPSYYSLSRPKNSGYRIRSNNYQYSGRRWY